ncbi:unnamed protein product [Cladocopium goreaui]|uniref:Retrovirus-related Pol polyprotein from transposon TNT 1-94 n=1 Tax=Cladocopium goreaui TaxID=2562237 RepID=A0A9P1GIN4_9DINO|nr:unnamed protein product [Cladocopium goreaui]
MPRFTVAPLLAVAVTATAVTAPASCWSDGSWLECCTGPRRCWSNARRQQNCCSSSPEHEPMQTDLHVCSNDLAFRKTYRLVKHQSLGLEEDCVSLVACKPTEGSWRALEIGEPKCSAGSSTSLTLEIADALCATLDPFPPESWYDAPGFELARRRHRFGTAARDHCAVPAWMYLREEPLRLYSLIQAKSNVTRVLINIGAGDGAQDDPLGRILQSYAGSGGLPPWKGVYFEAVPENCRAIRSTLDDVGAQIGIRCGYSTPNTVLQGICEELRDQEVPGIATICHVAAVLGIEATNDELQEDLRVEVDAMNVDIDSYDCAALREALRVVSPKMLSVEIWPYPPPIVVSVDFHPQHQETQKTNVSGYGAISGTTTREGGFVTGCSLSAAVALLWPHGRVCIASARATRSSCAATWRSRSAWRGPRSPGRRRMSFSVGGSSVQI